MRAFLNGAPVTRVRVCTRLVRFALTHCVVRKTGPPAGAVHMPTCVEERCHCDVCMHSLVLIFHPTPPKTRLHIPIPTPPRARRPTTNTRLKACKQLSRHKLLKLRTARWLHCEVGSHAHLRGCVLRVIRLLSCCACCALYVATTRRAEQIGGEHSHVMC
jgi:hypothetical protein